MAVVEPVTLGRLLTSAAERWPNRVAIAFPDGCLTYSALLERAAEIGRGLVGLGVQPGGHVAVLMANSPEFVSAMFGAFLAGAVVIPINTRYRSVELPHVIRDAQVQVLVTSTRTDDHVNFLGLLREAMPGLMEALDGTGATVRSAPALQAIVVLGGMDQPGIVGETSLLAKGRDVASAELWRRLDATEGSDRAIVLYTSGTTSQPSGCLLTNATLLRNWRAVGALVGIAAGEGCWAPAPLFHITGLGPLLFCFSAGATYISDTYFDADRALGLLTSLRPAVLWPAYPPIIQALMALPGFHPDQLASTRLMLAVAPPETMRGMQHAFGRIRLISLYGSTETTVPTLTRPGDSDETRLSTCGRVLADGIAIRIRDLDSEGNALADQVGEIMVRGFGLFDGYLGNTGKTEAAFDAAGWFCTGDLGSIDEDGRLRFVGRLKEMLKVGGENVAPAEVEAHLSTHPAVKLVQVVGVPDERLGEVAVAFVELLPGKVATEADLIGHCTDRLARFKVPRHVRFTSDWPMSASKIRKAPLVDRFMAEPGVAAGGR